MANFISESICSFSCKQQSLCLSFCTCQCPGTLLFVVLLTTFSADQWSILKNFVNITVKCHSDNRWSLRAATLDASLCEIEKAIAIAAWWSNWNALYTYGCSYKSQMCWKFQIYISSVLLVRSFLFFWSDSEISTG